MSHHKKGKPRLFFGIRPSVMSQGIDPEAAATNPLA
jgi:hypothetical protein